MAVVPLRTVSALRPMLHSLLLLPPPPPHPPSFLDGSPSLSAGVVGLGAASRSAHDTFLGVELTVGQTLDFHFRLAANIHLAPIAGSGGFSFLGRVAPVYLPMMWADRYATADDAQLAAFTSRVGLARTLINTALYGGIALAAVAATAALAFLGAAWQRSQGAQLLREAELTYYHQLLEGYEAAAAGSEAEAGLGGSLGAGGAAGGASRDTPLAASRALRLAALSPLQRGTGGAAGGGRGTPGGDARMAPHDKVLG